MKLSADSAAFSRAFAAAARFVPANATLPALLSVFLIADDEGVTLEATNRDQSIRLAVPGVTIEEPGSAVIPVDPAAGLFAACPPGSLTLTGDGGHLSIWGGGDFEADLNTIDPDTFPVLDQFDLPATLSLESSALQLLIRRTGFVGRSETAGRLKTTHDGMLADWTPEGLTLVAFDGLQLVHQTAAAATPATPGPGHKGPILPAKSMALLAGLLDGGRVEVGFTPFAASFRAGPVCFSTRLLEGSFTPWRSVPKWPEAARLQVPVAGLRQCLAVASPMTSPESRRVRLGLTPGKLEVASYGTQKGKAKSSIPIDYAGPPLDYFASAELLAGPLRVIDAESLTVVFHGPGLPIYYLSDGFHFGVAPMEG